jgi:hypothetical protein
MALSDSSLSIVLDALGWSGSGYTVSVFVVTDSPAPPLLRFETETVHPSLVRTYFLEDEERVLGESHTYEYDLNFTELPPELRSYLEECLRQACDGGAKLAWLGFEGSFSFDYLLADQVADQIYGVCTASGELLVALDDATLTSDSWKAELSRLRASLR